MAISKDIIERLKGLLKENPEGLSITDIVKAIPINRNTASRYLDTLLVSGQVEMRNFGMAKIYSLANRLPISSVLAISSEYVLQVDQSFRIIFVNAPFLDLLEISERDLIGKKIEYTHIPALFDEEFSLLQRWISDAHSGIERKGELILATKGRIFSCRVTPAVFAEGQKGVSVLFEDITARRRDEQRLKDSEEKFRSIVEASTDGIYVCDEQGRTIEWNEALVRITGITRKEAIGTQLTDLIIRTAVPEDGNRAYVDSITSDIKNALRKQKSRYFSIPFEVDIQRPDGERRIIRQTLFPIETERGIRIGSVVHDTTERRLMLEGLRESEEKFRTLFNHAADIITVNRIQPDGSPGTFTEVNDVACRRLGYTREELVRMKPADIVDPAMLGCARANSEKLRADGHTIFEITLITKDKRRIPVEIRTHLFEYQGQTHVIAQIRDITQKKAAEAAIQEREARLQSIIRAAPAGIGMVANRVIREVNDQLCTMTGYTSAELIGKSARVLYSSDEEFEQVGVEKYRQIALVGRGSIETRWKRKDGEIIDILLSSTPLDPRDLSAGVIFTALDVSEQARAETALRESEERYRKLVEISPDAVLLHQDGKILYGNPAAQKLLGIPEQDGMIGRPILDFVEPAFRDIVRRNIRKDLEGEESPHTELLMQKPDGTLVPVEGRGVVTRINGRPAVMVSLRDVTERNQADLAIRSSEMRYRHLIERSFNAVIVHKNGKIFIANEAACRIAGAQSPDELIGRPINTFVHADFKTIVGERVAEMFARPGTAMPLMRQKFLRVNGDPVEVEVMATSFLDNGTPAFQVIFREITDQVEMEQALRASEEQYRTLAESASDVIYITDTHGRLLYANPACSGMYGCRTADIVGKTQEDLFPPEIARVHLEAIRNVVTTGRPFEHEECIPSPGGIARIDVKLSPICSQDGSVVSVMGIARDITSRDRHNSSDTC
jgi:PAS domain S-box-containing protein